MKYGENRNSVLVAGVPRERGTPTHYERPDDTAFVAFDGNVLREVHTPQNPFPRVHEFMHMLHTDNDHNGSGKTYSGVAEDVRQVIEDCRLHLNFWPWSNGETPIAIEDDTRRHLQRERAELTKALKGHPERRGKWPDFATRIRQVAIRRGLGDPFGPLLRRYFPSDSERKFATQLVQWIEQGEERKAAQWLDRIYFPMVTIPEGFRFPWMPKRTNAWDPETANLAWNEHPPMEVIELSHTEKIPEAKIGYRRATTGARLHRPSLRKVILPQRLFVRRLPYDPGGTILIDASGSMGDFNEITRWCEKAPFGTIAYYAGTDDTEGGQLFVYARNGRRAQRIVHPADRGNSVDGPAMDWLLSEKPPRIMVTDREFCGASDSTTQIHRLSVLESMGLIEVRDYRRNGDEDE
jgi:hypothetical protein